MTNKQVAVEDKIGTTYVEVVVQDNETCRVSHVQRDIFRAAIKGDAAARRVIAQLVEVNDVFAAID